MNKLIENDPYLKPYTSFFDQWKSFSEKKEFELCGDGQLIDFAQGHHYFGLHQEADEIIIREWAPNADQIFLVGECNNWEEQSKYKFSSIGNGNWELRLSMYDIQHKSLYALEIYFNNTHARRIPSWATRVVQDDHTHIFNAQVWLPIDPFVWKYDVPKLSQKPIIYEAHIGMSGEEEMVHSFKSFTRDILPKIHKAGYNTIQLMAIAEHPYYGSFGYHVSNYFASSSRFGTPEELKTLIDEAHSLGIVVIMDLVHSHAVKNEIEGLGKYDGTQYQFFHQGDRGIHPAWDSYCFDYSKNEVLHFLLSNIQFWQTEYHFDGFRFDGVTSMLYKNHGLECDFLEYKDYFSDNLEVDAIVYLQLANKLMKQIDENSLSIAEEMSGLPGLAAPISDGGIGFDYRMAMGVPDYWIKQIKEVADENWHVGDMFYQLTSHRDDEEVISYVESHDQALVGDKTVFFRLIDQEIYYSMQKDQPNMSVERGVALHKMIRLYTLSCAAGGYLSFMGNEFGHPEWIDFPREGNDWSFLHARRQWTLQENKNLKFHWLSDFDRKMIHLFGNGQILSHKTVLKRKESVNDQIIAFTRGHYLFVFNFNPVQSFPDYEIEFEPAKFKVVLNTDSGIYGGFDRIDERMTYYTIPIGSSHQKHALRLYIPSRSAFVLEIIPFTKAK